MARPCGPARTKRPAHGRGGCGCARGFTLIEVCIAIAVVIVLLALVFPSAESLLRGTFGEVCSQTIDSLELARADAQREGVVVVVRAVASGRETMIEAELRETPGFGVVRDGDRMEAGVGSAEPRARRRVYFTLPEGYRISAPSEAMVDAEEGGFGPPPEMSVEEDRPIIVTFLPSGAAVAGAVVRIEQVKDGEVTRAAHLDISEWAAGIVYREVDPDGQVDDAGSGDEAAQPAGDATGAEEEGMEGER